MAGDKPTYTYRFLEEAEADFLEGLSFYAERDRTVARRFDRLIKHAVAIIVDTPRIAGPSRTAPIGTSSATASRTPSRTASRETGSAALRRARTNSPPSTPR